MSVHDNDNSNDICFCSSSILPDSLSLQENVKCAVSGPSDYGKTYLLTIFFINQIYFHMLYIIVPTGDQIENTESINDDVMLNLLRFQKICPHMTSCLKIKTKLMIFDDVGAKDTIFNEFYCRTKHRNFSMIYVNQNLFALD